MILKQVTIICYPLADVSRLTASIINDAVI